MNNSFIEIYRSPEGDVQLNVKLENDTVWPATFRADVVSFSRAENKSPRLICEAGCYIVYCR